MAKSKLISAIDIGSSKVTALIAQYREEESEKLHIVGAASTPSRGVRKGQIVNIEEAVMAISESVEAAERMAGVEWPCGGAHGLAPLAAAGKRHRAGKAIEHPDAHDDVALLCDGFL